MTYETKKGNPKSDLEVILYTKDHITLKKEEKSR